MYSLVWLILVCSKTNKTALKKKKTKAAPRSLGSELPSIYYRQGGAAGKEAAGKEEQQARRARSHSPEDRILFQVKKTLSKPEPPEGFPGPTYHNSKGLSGVQWKLQLQQVPPLLLSTPRFENPRPGWPLAGRQHQEKRKEPRKHGPASASEEPCRVSETRLLFHKRPHPRAPAGRGGMGCLSCPWVCGRFACVCLAQSLCLTGTRETDFINRCEHEWFL